MARVEERSRLEQTGRWLIAAGVSVWLIYVVVWALGGGPEGAHYLPFHLSGVIPGAVLSRWGAVRDWFSRRR